MASARVPLLYETCINSVDMEASSVSQYYGEVLQQSSDLQTNACCTIGEIPDYMKKALNNIHDDVMMKYYGCGLVHPECLKGASICDLGCGAGRDCYVLAQLVGEEGSVTGVDFNDEQLKVARGTEDWHMNKFGYSKSNVKFFTSHIEDISALPSGSFDVIVSNCVVNLSPDKKAVLSEAFRLLRPGGEMYFSDVYSSQRVPAALKKDPVLWGECLSGALYWNDFLRLSRECGFKDSRLVKDAPITIENDAMKALLGPIEFFSATYRMFKLVDLEPDCEDYGQAVVYHGTVPDHPSFFQLDNHHKIMTGKVFTVCGNTFRMLKETRFEPHFTFIGDFSRHFGLFEGCGKSPHFADSAALSTSGSCC